MVLLRFLWELLARERLSGFGTRHSAERASVFDPSQWFWCRPGQARADEAARLRQQRERYLAQVPLPCRDGQWRAAGTIGFGSDWADWLAGGSTDGRLTSTTQQRIEAYRALDAVSPGAESLVAPPDIVLPFLDARAFDEAIDDHQAEVEDVPEDRQRDSERHAFLLRLGVWEVPPVEAFESRDIRNRKRFPWTGETAERQQALVADAGGWRFAVDGWGGQEHHNVYLAEDYRFLWDLSESARRDRRALVTSLRLGARLYADRLAALVFCPGCPDAGHRHTAMRHSIAADAYPSTLKIQLRTDEWVPGTLDGSPLPNPVSPPDAWWRKKPPTGAGLRQSPWRFVPLCGEGDGMTEDLVRLVGVNILGEASVASVGHLLADLRSRFTSGTLPEDPLQSGTARQAFVGLHRLAYERLAELTNDSPGEVGQILDGTEVLCELGDKLAYRPVAEARHDNGRHSTYVRHFIGEVPFVVVPRDGEVVAARLKVPPFRVHLSRRGGDDGRDVTDDVRSILGDRVPELLSIVVHHSLGPQTLEVTGEQFPIRARRLQNLTVRQVDDLIIDATAEGFDRVVSIGEGSTEELFLEGPDTAAPVLLHDLSGEGWQASF